MINAVVDAARHCLSRRKRFEFQREDATANSGLATRSGPMAPKEKSRRRQEHVRQGEHGRQPFRGAARGRGLLAEDPAGLLAEAAAPILCASVAADSPMQHWGVKPGLEG